MNNVTHPNPKVIVGMMTRRLSTILANPGDGIVSLVDRILTSCADDRVEVEFREDFVRGLVLGCGAEFRLLAEFELLGESIPKSVLRAIIARVAALCNEQTPNAVSPYCGEGELTISAKPGALLKAVFANTADQQHLTLTTLRTAIEVPSGQQIGNEDTAAGAGNLVPLRR